MTPTSPATPPTAAPPTSTATPPPLAGQYLVDDFESGLGSLQTQGPGGATAQGATVNSGTGAVALTNTTGQYVGLAGDLQGGPQALTFSRFCFRLAGGLTGSSVLAQGRDA